MHIPVFLNAYPSVSECIDSWHIYGWNIDAEGGALDLYAKSVCLVLRYYHISNSTTVGTVLCPPFSTIWCCIFFIFVWLEASVLTRRWQFESPLNPQQIPCHWDRFLGIETARAESSNDYLKSTTKWKQSSSNLSRNWKIILFLTNLRARINVDWKLIEGCVTDQ